jgi:signal transduction histidine kinase
MEIHQTEQDLIDELNREAWSVRVSDSVRSGLLSREAMVRSRSIDYRKGLAESLRTYGFSSIRQSRLDESLICLDEAEQIFLDLDDRRGLSDIFEYRGIIARSKGDLKGSLEYLFRSLELRKDSGYSEGEVLSLYHLGVTYRYLGNLQQALDYLLESLELSREVADWIGESYSINNIGSIYLEMGNLAQALTYFKQSLAIREKVGDKWGAAGCYDNIGLIFLREKEFGSAREHFEKALEISASVQDKKGEGNARLHLAELELESGNTLAAETHARQCLALRKGIGDKKGQAEVILLLSEIVPLPQREASLNEALGLARETGALDLEYKSHGRLYHYFKGLGRFDKALEYLELHMEEEKAFHSRLLSQRIANLQLEHEVEQSRKESEIYRLKNVELAKALEDLRSTQEQLVLREKMASLGELTAGIAHEIRNPLNFINNFSELNLELIAEARQALASGDPELVLPVIRDLNENEEKILYHGQRADAIVKSMLLHSGSSDGRKELTDINALAEECLRLAYHACLSGRQGFNGKNIFFHVSCLTEFDLSLPPVSVIPQDIARVLLNLLNNAFYAVAARSAAVTSERAGAVPHTGKLSEHIPEGNTGNGAQANGGEAYEPTVRIATKRTDQGVVIRVEDNGAGIPEHIMEKIFQPFFTTKPTGQGTGLGLSLSYEIVTRGHGGQLKAEPGLESGSVFTVILPCQP